MIEVLYPLPEKSGFWMFLDEKELNTEKNPWNWSLRKHCRLGKRGTHCREDTLGSWNIAWLLSRTLQENNL